MKNINLTTVLVLTIMLFSISCKKKTNEAQTSTTETAAEAKSNSESFIVDTNASVIEWKGFKPTEFHNGTLQLKSGNLTANDNQIESGNFLVDMNSIVVLDIPADEKSNGKLVGHLKNADFFDVTNHNTSSFEVTGFSNENGKTMLSGNLNIKGIAHNITFPVSVTQNGAVLTLNSEAFSIDRTKWDIKYKSKSIFGDLGDKFIKDDIELKVSLVANK